MTNKEKLDTIDDLILKLNIERQKIQKEFHEEFQQEERCRIGHCYRIGSNRWAVVTDVPQSKNLKNTVEFNKYQFPALYVSLAKEDEDAPIYEDRIFSAAWGAARDEIDAYEEITPEEFLERFDYVASCMRIKATNAIEERKVLG